MKQNLYPPNVGAANVTKEVLTITELSNYTGYSIAYLYKLTHQRKIPFYKPATGRRVFFLLEEINSWLTGIKGATIYELKLG